MKNLIYIIIGCAIILFTFYTVLRPFEKDLIKECQQEYANLLNTTKQLTEDYNEVMDLLRETYRQGDQ